MLRKPAGAHRPILVFVLAFFANGLVVWSLGSDEIFEQAVFRMPTAIDSKTFVSADFNGDGRKDLAVNNGAAGTISISLGQGNGSFTPGPELSTEGWLNVMTVADFNSDGAQDLAFSELILGSPYINQVAIVLGNGDGTFGPETHVPVEAVLFLGTGDFNGDGRTDLLVPETHKLIVLLGAGDGTFPSSREIALSAYSPWSIAVGDLNEDGVQDLVVGDQDGSYLSVLLGNGDGTFLSETRYPANQSKSVALGDFNGDGHQDVATGHGYSSPGFPFYLAVFLGLGNGLLGEKIGVESGVWGTLEISVGDFDRDGRQDLAVTQDAAGSEVSLFRGSGDGHFTRYGAIGADERPAHTVLDDFTGDGIADAAILAWNADVIRVVPGNETGSFAPPTRGDSGAPPVAAAAADVNGDGRVDLITANSISSDVSVLFGRGDGTFDPAARYPTGPGPVSVAVADLNGDGSVDIVTADSGSPLVSVLLGTGGGSFGPPSQFSAGSADHTPQAVAVGDLNADGRPDLIVGNAGVLTYVFPPPPQPPQPVVSPGFVSVLDGIGDGTFAAQRTFPGGRDPRFVVAGDFNDDGRTDLAVTTWLTLDPTNSDVWILPGLGGGNFDAPYPVATGYKPTSIAVGDFNADGYQDLAVASAVNQYQNASNVGIALGNGNGGFLQLSQYTTTSCSGSRLSDPGCDSQSVVTDDFDQDGRLDLAVANTRTSDISVMLGAGDGTFGPQTLYPVSQPVFLAVADSNGDGGSDLLAASPISSSVWVLPNLHHAPLHIVDITVSNSSPLGHGSGTIRWTTTREDELKGFNVIAFGNTGARTTMNITLIGCEECITGLGHSYTFYVPKHKSAKNLFIEAVHVDGSAELFGPALKLND